MRQSLLDWFSFWRKFFRHGGFKRFGFIWVFSHNGRIDAKRRIRNRGSTLRSARKYGSFRKRKKTVKQQLLARYGSFCNSCRKKFDHDQLTIDHVIRIRDGGDHRLCNLQLLCDECHKLKDLEFKIEPSSFVNNPFADAFERANMREH